MLQDISSFKGILPPEMMNQMPEWVTQLLSQFQEILAILSWVVGGIFGLSLIFFLVKLYMQYRMVKTIKEIKKDIELIKEKLEI